MSTFSDLFVIIPLCILHFISVMDCSLLEKIVIA